MPPEFSVTASRADQAYFERAAQAYLDDPDNQGSPLTVDDIVFNTIEYDATDGVLDKPGWTHEQHGPFPTFQDAKVHAINLARDEAGYEENLGYVRRPLWLQGVINVIHEIPETGGNLEPIGEDLVLTITAGPLAQDTAMALSASTEAA